MGEKLESKSALWFRENVSEDAEDLLKAAELANSELHNKISLTFPNPMTTIAVYANIFETICKVIAEKETEWEDFCLNIANRLKIGYTTTSSEDDEKQGNFMVFLQHIYDKTSDDSLNDENDNDETDTVVLCTQWNATNVKTQTELINTIASIGKKNLGNLINIKLESPEFIIPTFCIIHSCIIRYLQLKRTEEKNACCELNVAGLYTVGCQETDDAEEEIYFVPSISLKLLFKNDAQATGINE